MRQRRPSLEGTIFEVVKFFKRKSLFQQFFKHHAAVLSNGKLAVDALEAAYSISEKIKDGYSFENPCPPTIQRVVAYDTATRTVGSPFHMAAGLSGQPMASPSFLIVNGGSREKS